MKRSQIKLVVAALAVLALAVSVSACGGSSGGGSSSGSSAEGKKGPVNVAFLASSVDGYDTALEKGIKAAQAANGGGELQVLSGEYNPAKQLQECQDVVTRGEAQAIVVDPVTNPALVPCLAEVEEAGIKIGSVDTPIGPDYSSTEIQEPQITAQVIMPITDDASAAAQLVVEACKGKDPCEVAVLIGDPEFTYSSERVKYMKKYLEKHSNVEIVAEEVGGLGEPKVSLAATQNILTSHPGVDVIVSDDDYGLTGAQQAVEEAGKTEQVALIGGGGTNSGIEHVKNGEFFGTVLYLPVTEAEILTEDLIKAVRGEEIAEPDLTDKKAGPYGTTLVNQANAAEIRAQWE
jgi:ribose transport system substrate-binding protein